MTREQLLALLRETVGFIHHDEWCSVVDDWHVGVQCTCGMRELLVRVEDALATERTETNDGDDDGN